MNRAQSNPKWRRGQPRWHRLKFPSNHKPTRSRPVYRRPGNEKAADCNHDQVFGPPHCDAAWNHLSKVAVYQASYEIVVLTVWNLCALQATKVRSHFTLAIGKAVKPAVNRDAILVYDTNGYGRQRFGRGAALGDRKSTRLNSSHGSISYAVFCLKKKNLHTNRDQTSHET